MAALMSLARVRRGHETRPTRVDGDNCFAADLKQRRASRSPAGPLDPMGRGWLAPILPSEQGQDQILVQSAASGYPPRYGKIPTGLCHRRSSAPYRCCSCTEPRVMAENLIIRLARRRQVAPTASDHRGARLCAIAQRGCLASKSRMPTLIGCAAEPRAAGCTRGG